MNDTCTYLMLDGETHCGKPVVADYCEYDQVRGSVPVASLCRTHHNRAAMAYATAHQIVWNERGTVPQQPLVLVPG